MAGCWEKGWEGYNTVVMFKVIWKIETKVGGEGEELSSPPELKLHREYKPWRDFEKGFTLVTLLVNTMQYMFLNDNVWVWAWPWNSLDLWRRRMLENIVHIKKQKSCKKNYNLWRIGTIWEHFVTTWKIVHTVDSQGRHCNIFTKRKTYVCVRCVIFNACILQRLTVLENCMKDFCT